MAFKAYTPDNAGDILLPFHSDFASANPSRCGELFRVTGIFLAKSGKGYMVQTTDFVCWVWKNSKIAKELIADVELAIPNGISSTLLCQLNSEGKDGYVLGWDTEIAATVVRDGDNSYFFSSPTTATRSTKATRGQ
jgi:hypothetical protein